MQADVIQLNDVDTLLIGHDSEDFVFDNLKGLTTSVPTKSVALAIFHGENRWSLTVNKRKYKVGLFYRTPHGMIPFRLEDMKDA